MKYIFCSRSNSLKSNDSIIIYQGSINDFIQKNIPNVAYVCPCNHLGRLLIPPYFPNTQIQLTANLNSRKAVNLDIGYSTIVASPYANIHIFVPVITSAAGTSNTKNLFWATVASNNHVDKFNRYNPDAIKTIEFPDFSKILTNITAKQIADQLSEGIVSDLNFDIFPNTSDVYFTKYGTYRR